MMVDDLWMCLYTMSEFFFTINRLLKHIVNVMCCISLFNKNKIHMQGTKIECCKVSNTRHMMCFYISHYHTTI